MTSHNKIIEILKIIIDDERHYRNMFQSRISYHTSIILALIGLIGALATIDNTPINYLILSVLGILVFAIAQHTISANERIYLHFIETIRAREKIEYFLGIRDISRNMEDQKDDPIDIKMTVGDDQSNKYWPYQHLFIGSWVPNVNKEGYFYKAKKLFEKFKLLGIVIFIFFFILGIKKMVFG